MDVVELVSFLCPCMKLDHALVVGDTRRAEELESMGDDRYMITVHLVDVLLHSGQGLG